MSDGWRSAVAVHTVGLSRVCGCNQCIAGSHCRATLSACCDPRTCSAHACTSKRLGVASLCSTAPETPLGIVGRCQRAGDPPMPHLIIATLGVCAFKDEPAVRSACSRRIYITHAPRGFDQGRPPLVGGDKLLRHVVVTCRGPLSGALLEMHRLYETSESVATRDGALASCHTSSAQPPPSTTYLSSKRPFGAGDCTMPSMSGAAAAKASPAPALPDLAATKACS